MFSSFKPAIFLFGQIAAVSNSYTSINFNDNLGYKPVYKPLLIALSVSVLFLFIVGIILLLFLLPIIGQSLGFIDKNGIKGVLDLIMPVLDKLWNGQN